MIVQQTVRCSNLEEPEKKLSVASPQVEYCDESRPQMAGLSRPIPKEDIIYIYTHCVLNASVGIQNFEFKNKLSVH